MRGAALLTSAYRWARDPRVAWLRRRLWGTPAGSLVRLDGYTIRATDGPNLYMQYKDEFVRRIYDFVAARPDPFVVDGGGNMGMSVLYVKRRYPRARVLVFEPDPDVFRVLSENVERNGLRDVELVNAGLAADEGVARFVPDRAAGGRIAAAPEALEIRTVRLSTYLDRPVDFLKLNIEGAELPVLQELAASGRLANVDQMVVEYHGWADGQQRLGAILELLDREGFRYLVHDFDGETNGASKPPFRLTPRTTWFCLVYARRPDAR